MQRILLIGAAAIAILAPQVQAGSLTANDGQANWKSTQCVVPVRPASLKDSDAEYNANELNEKIVQYNQYTAQVQAYMECVRQEAQSDVSTAQQAAFAEAERAIQFAREENDKVRAQFKPEDNKKAEKKQP